MPFIPHTQADIDAMLATLSYDNLEALWSDLPKGLKLTKAPAILPILSEQALKRVMRERAARDHHDLCFLGAGAYEHHIPAAVWDLASRGEWMTAYTPYQAEASQGTLQMLYEYQTMIADLTGMHVANASLYEGASALAEAALMAVRSQKRPEAKRILVPEHVHPHYREVLTTVLTAQAIPMSVVPVDRYTGLIQADVLAALPYQDVAALIIPFPSFWGSLEQVDVLTNWAHAQGALVIACVNPTALALLREPGAWGEHGADIVCGEAQPLGIPLSSGGPYCGFMACKLDYIRQLPGRIVGRTVDGAGKTAYTLTLQAREQHIRRGKATSNICTNQGLAAMAATVYMSLMGTEGLPKIALACFHRAHTLAELLTTVEGVELVFHGPYFHEFVIRLPKSIKAVLTHLENQGIIGGLSLETYYPDLKNCLLVNVTETKTQEDLEQYAYALSLALSSINEVCEVQS